jgi:hypothetical protein
MIRKLIKNPIVLALVLGGTFACAYEAFRFRCTETVLSEAMSPDGAWKASVYERLREGPFPTYTIDGVRLMSTHDPAGSADILRVPYERPSIVWATPRTLVANVPGSLDLQVLTCNVWGVRIAVRLPPDDAANRAAVYRQIGQPDPDPSGKLTRNCQ